MKRLTGDKVRLFLQPGRRRSRTTRFASACAISAMTLAISIARMDSGRRSRLSRMPNAPRRRQLWDSDLIELQLAHLDERPVKAIYNRTAPSLLIGARAKMVQHWANRIDKIVAAELRRSGSRRLLPKLK